MDIVFGTWHGPRNSGKLLFVWAELSGEKQFMTSIKMPFQFYIIYSIKMLLKKVSLARHEIFCDVGFYGKIGV